VELSGILCEFSGEVGVVHRGGALDGALIDIDEEFVVEGFAPEEYWEVVAAAVGESEVDAHALPLDDGGEGDAVADMDVTGRVANTLDFVFVGGDFCARIEGTLGGEEAKLKLTIRVDGDIRGPN